jgi:hypothetical protein
MTKRNEPMTETQNKLSAAVESLLAERGELDTQAIADALGWRLAVVQIKCNYLLHAGRIRCVRPATIGRFGERAIYAKS